MIAIAKKKSIEPRFEELLPSIRRLAQRAFRYHSLDKRDDLIAEAVANAYHAYSRLVERDKTDIIYATPLAQYAIKQVCSGRQVGNHSNVNDVSSAYAQRAKGFQVERLDFKNAAQDCWYQFLIEDKSSGPAAIAVTRIDFATWLETLKPKLRSIAQVLATGEATSLVAKQFGISSARVSQLRRELQQAWQEFQGELAVA